MKRLRKRIWRCVKISLLVWVVTYAVGVYMGRRVKISRSTTFLTEPVGEDGMVDYVAAIRQKYGKGVTPQNNAAPLLLRIIGPPPWETDTQATRPDAASVGEPWVRLMKYLDKIPPDVLPRPAKGTPRPSKYDLEDRVHEMIQRDADFSPEFLGMLEDGMLRDVLRYRHLPRATSAPWRAEEFPVIAAWLEVNRHRVALVPAATQRPRYYIASDWAVAKITDFDAPTVHRLGALQDIGEALACQAMLQVRNGQLAEAWSNVLAGHRLSRLLAGQGAIPGERIVSMRIENHVARAAQGLATSGRLSAGQAREYLGHLQALGPLPAVMGLAYEIDRFHLLEVAQLHARGEIPYPWPETGQGIGPRLYDYVPTLRYLAVDWDQVLARLNRYYDQVQEAMQKPTHSTRRKALQAMTADTAQAWPRGRPWGAAAVRTVKWSCLSGVPVVGRTCVAKEVAAAMLSEHDAPAWGMLSRYEEARAAGVLAKTALALAAFRAETGRMPAKLEELTPKYFAILPVDPITAKPPLYRKKMDGWVLYSVGENDMDDHGVESADRVVCRRRTDDGQIVNVYPARDIVVRFGL